MESCKTIIQVNETGCMVVCLKDLELCEKVVISMNNGTLDGL